MKLTKELLHPRGSEHNKAELEALGLSWPPKKGWLTRLIGAEISEAQYAKFLAAGGNEITNTSGEPESQPKWRMEISGPTGYRTTIEASSREGLYSEIRAFIGPEKSPTYPHRNLHDPNIY